MKHQLDFQAVILVENNVNIAACSVQGMNFAIGTVGSRQAND